jgi:hypothetical protein
MKSKLLYPLIAFVILVALTLACGESNTGEKVGEQGESPTSPPPTVAVYTVGDVIKVGDHTIVLNSAEFEGNMLKANFTIENKGAEEINVSSMLSFYAKDSEGTKLEQEIFDCGTSFDGKVLPGDKLKGDICWSGAATDSIKIYYEAELFGSGAVVWEVTK